MSPGDSRNPPSAHGFVLAGGMSRRMGTDKALLVYRGRSLLERAVDVLRSLDLPVTVVTASGRSYDLEGVPVLEDEIPEAGPLGGLVTALRSTATDQNHVLACDLPYVVPGVFLLLRRSASDADVVLPEDGRGRVHPLCALYDPRCLAVAERLLESGERRMSALLEAPDLRVKRVPAGDGGFSDEVFTNLNDSDDWRRLLRA